MLKKIKKLQTFPHIQILLLVVSLMAGGCDFLDPGITPKKIELTAVVSSNNLQSEIIALDFFVDDRLSGNSRILVVTRDKLVAIDSFGGIVSEKSLTSSKGVILGDFKIQDTAAPLALVWDPSGQFKNFVFNANDDSWIDSPISGETPSRLKSICAKLTANRLEVFDYHGSRSELIIEGDRMDGLRYRFVPSGKLLNDVSCEGLGMTLDWDDKRHIEIGFGSPALKFIHQERPDETDAFILIKDGFGAAGIKQATLLAMTEKSLGGVGFKDGAVAVVEDGRVVLVAKSNLDEALVREAVLVSR